MQKKDDKSCHTIFSINNYEAQNKTNYITINCTIEHKELRVNAKTAISDQILNLTVDTGAQISTLRPCKLFGDTKVDCDVRIPIIGIAKNLTLFTLGQIETQIIFDEIPFDHKFQIVKGKFNIANDGIIGNDFLMKYGATIDYENNKLILRAPQKNMYEISQSVIIPKNGSQMRDRHSNTSRRKKKDKNYFKYNDVTVKPDTQIVSLKTISLENADIFSLNDKDTSETFNIKMASSNSDEITDSQDRRDYLMARLDLSHCTEGEKKGMANLCEKYSNAFYIEGDKFRHTNVVSHFIALKPNTNPIFTRQYRLPEMQKQEILRQIDELEKKGVVEKSDSAWNSPVHLVPKKDSKDGEKEQRMVVNYSKLNAVTIPHTYPIPLIDEIIDQMNGAQFFTTLDVKGAFHHIPMHESCREYTSFSTAFNKYHFRSNPFGLVGSPYTWLRAIHTILEDVMGKNVFVYVDDIIVYSSTYEDHMNVLGEVFQRLIKHNIKLKINKSEFLKREVAYLGHILTKDGVKADHKKIECMKQFPRPTSVTEMQKFLGMTNYYRRYVDQYAKIAKPLYSLCKKDNPFIWSPACEEAFCKLKEKLVTSPVLIYPDFKQTFIVTTDASEYAVGAVVSQGDIPHDRPIQYFSKTLGPAQSNYSVIEKELLAIVWAIENFRHYLYGREFLVITDHKPLIYLFGTKNINSRLYRWKLTLMEYQFKIIHRKGTQNVVADALSRIRTNDIEGNEKRVESLESILEKSNLCSVKVIQTRSKTLQLNDPQKQEQAYFIEENNGMLVDSNEFDQVFYLFENEDCEMKKRLEHKLNRVITIPQSFHQNELLQLNDRCVILKMNPVIRSDNQIKSAEKIIGKIIQLSSNKLYENIAINVDLSDAPSYFNFKMITQKLMRSTHIRTTFYLCKTIDVSNQDEINKVLNAYHRSLLGGHTGVERMKNTIRRYFQWPSMTKDIREFIKNCAVCEKSKITTHTKNPIQISSTATFPFEKVYIDIVGPITPISIDGHKYILTCNCDLTKFAIAVPISEASALTTAKAFVHQVILKYGIPKVVVSDNGSNFISDTMKQVSKLLKMKRILTTPYHPQSNQVERFHRSLSSYLKAYIQNEKEYWSNYLDFALFVYNNTYNSTTGFAPFELIYGRASEIPCEITNQKVPVYNYDNYAVELRAKLRSMHQLAAENILRRKHANKHYHDSRAKTNILALKRNDLVLLLKAKRDFKFDQPYEGPYRVEEILSPVVVTIRKGKKAVKINTDRLKMADANYGSRTPPLV